MSLMASTSASWRNELPGSPIPDPRIPCKTNPLPEVNIECHFTKTKQGLPNLHQPPEMTKSKVGSKEAVDSCHRRESVHSVTFFNTMTDGHRRSHEKMRPKGSTGQLYGTDSDQGSERSRRGVMMEGVSTFKLTKSTRLRNVKPPSIILTPSDSEHDGELANSCCGAAAAVR